MKREIRMTKDGSPTLYVAELDEHYHSIHGALQESLHVFIDAGLRARNQTQVSILEIGFGTGLNALLTAIEAENLNLKVEYTGIEKYPVTVDELARLNFDELPSILPSLQLLNNMHEVPWNKPIEITAHFTLTKRQQDFKQIDDIEKFDLIYFDAFAPSAQPNLWTEDIFKRMYNALKANGILVTYCAKGQVKRNMKAAGFSIECLPGPPGKREMTRATK